MDKYRNVIILSTLLYMLAACSPTLHIATPEKQYKALGKSPSQSETLLYEADQALRQAKSLHDINPTTALACYLHSLYILKSQDSSNAWVNAAHHMAVGNAVQLAQEHQLWEKKVTYKAQSYHINIKQSRLALRYVDTLTPASNFSCKKSSSPLINTAKGTSLVAHYQWSKQRDEENPFLPPIGYYYPLTAVGKWQSNNTLSIALVNPDLHQNISYNYSAQRCIAKVKTSKLNRQGVRNVFHANSEDRSGLFCNEPLDPQKTPVIFVHGLASSPTIWIDPTYQLMQHPKIRENYQIFAYFYPTGLPIAYNAAILKLNIIQLQKDLRSLGAGNNSQEMVLIGHSMGGVISSMLTRDLTNTAETFFTINPEKIDMNKKSRRALLTLFDNPPLNCISRAIFIAAPHRGSQMANNWYGQLASNLIQIPSTIVRPNSEDYLANLSELGRNIIPSLDDLDGVKKLEYRNPALMYIVERPKVSRVTYHSIIGNRGRRGDLANSSDGVVPYSSSHLDNVASELIVPSGHGAQEHPDTIEELERILLLHLN